MRLAQALLDRNVRVYGTRRSKWGNSHDLEAEGKRSKIGKLAFQRNGDIMVQVWKEDLCE